MRHTAVAIRRWIPLVLGALFLACHAPEAESQVRGQVVDPSGQPVPRALVELWSNAERRSHVETDAHGRFEAVANSDAGEIDLTVRRVGFQTRTVHLASADTSLILRMELRPVLLDAVTVGASRQPACPNRDDPRARALWTAMRHRYWQPASQPVPVFGFVEIRSGISEKRDPGAPESFPTRAGWTTGSLIEAHPELMALSGYAIPARGGLGERTAFWSYRALEDGAMQDFTGDYFGATHTFSLVSFQPSQPVIRFCPRERMGATGRIEGTLALRSDTTISWARWNFRTPRPVEDAGGEATYYPPEPALGRALLAHETLFWRKSNGGSYYVQSQAYSGWRRAIP